MQKKEQKELKNSKGITLIALIITIIVMLILIGVTVTVVLKGGLFSSAKQASAKTQEEKEQEQELATGRIEIDGIWYDSMEDYANNKPSKDQTDIKYKKEKEELITAAQETKGIDGKVDIAKLEDKLEGWKIEGEEPYTCTSPSGNVYKMDETGEIIETGEALGTNAVRIGELIYYISSKESKTSMVLGDRGDCNYDNIIMILMSKPVMTAEEIEIASKVEINGEIYTVNGVSTGAFSSVMGEAVTTLKSVTIPDSVTSIGDQAFYNCTSLEKIIIPSSVISISGKAFTGTPWLERQQANTTDGFVIVNNILIDGTTAIGDIIIPNNVIKIASYAFNNNTKLTNVVIPNSITEIGGMAFMGCTKITKTTIPGSVVSIENSAFNGCTLLESITIEQGVKKIGSMTFNACEALEEIVIPSSISEIGMAAFAGTPWLTHQKTNAVDGLIIVNNILIDGTTASGSVEIPNTVTTINMQAFNSCAELEKITIPSSVRIIENGAFLACNSLTEIRVYWEEGNKPEGWDENWNGSSATVVYGYTGESE